MAVEGEKGPPRFEEFPDLAGSDVNLPVDQVEGRAVRRTVEHADERRSLGKQLPSDGLEIASEPLLPLASPKIERLHGPVFAASKAVQAHRTLKALFPALPVFQRERGQAHRA